MLRKKNISLLILIVTIVSCNSFSESRSISISDAPTFQGAPSTKSFLITSTKTIASSKTPTLFPTLMPEQVDKLLKDLLWNNPECTLPCFMGIVPGETKLEEVNALFTQTDPFYFCELDHDKSGYCSTSHRFDTGFAVYLEMTIKFGVVESLSIPLTLPRDQSISARKEWLSFAPSSLVKQYGVPSNVEVFLGLGATPSYTIDIYFSNIDFIYEYQSYDLQMQNLQICPNHDNFEYIRLWLGKNPVNPPFASEPIETSSILTREDFAKILTSDANGACFTLNREIFP